MDSPWKPEAYFQWSPFEMETVKILAQKKKRDLAQSEIPQI